MKLSSNTWEKLLKRWLPFQSTPESNLIVAVIADGIVNRERESWFFTNGGFETYCRIVGLDPEFVLQQIERASDYHA